MKNLKKIWKTQLGEKLVFENVNGTIQRLEKLAVVGVNGAGKSTLLKVIAGLTDASEGTAEIGASVTMGYFSQYSLDLLDPSKTLIEEVR